jgi:hypothetical protein
MCVWSFQYVISCHLFASIRAFLVQTIQLFTIIMLSKVITNHAYFQCEMHQLSLGLKDKLFNLQSMDHVAKGWSGRVSRGLSLPLIAMVPLDLIVSYHYYHSGTVQYIFDIL